MTKTSIAVETVIGAAILVAGLVYIAIPPTVIGILLILLGGFKFLLIRVVLSELDTTNPHLSLLVIERFNKENDVLLTIVGIGSYALYLGTIITGIVYIWGRFA